jgi:MFS family permease
MTALMAAQTNKTSPHVAPPQRAPIWGWYVLLALSLISLFSFADRYVLLLLAEPIRQHFSLSDVETGLLQGTGVALWAALASYPLGWLAGRYDNRILLAVCIAIWSIAVALSGLAQSFVQIFIFTGLVAAAEAGLSPVAYSLIPRLFTGAQRQAANSIFAATAIGGGALAIVLAGVLVDATPTLQPMLPTALSQMEAWRVSLILAAGAAPIMIAIALTLPIGPHPRIAPQPEQEAGAPAAASFWLYVHRHRVILGSVIAGSALAGMAFGAIGPWTAIAATRIFGATPTQVGAGMGAAQIISAVSAFLVSVIVTRIALPRFGAVTPALMLTATATGMLLCVLALPLMSSAASLYAFFAVFGFFLSMGAMFQPTVFQTIVPQPMIGRIVAVQFIATMLGASVVGPLVGAASDWLAPDGSRIVEAMAAIALPALVIAIALLQRVRGPRFHAARYDAEEINTNPVLPVADNIR